MRIGVTYDLRADYLAMGYGEEETAEFDAPETVDAICAALSALGHQPFRIGGIRSLTAALVRGERIDACFNICEGLRGYAREAQVPALLDAYEVPYVFSDALTLALALDKAMAKRVVRDQGVPTPDFVVLENVADAASVDLGYPLFVKPVSEGSGKGIDARSRVDDEDTLRQVVAALVERFSQPVLVEKYLSGREFTVGILGTGEDAQVLGVSEIVRTDKFVGHGYGYRNKEYWEDKVVIRLCEDEAGAAAGRTALAAWRALRCRDGGRVDIRNDEDGAPNFIEANPLAGLRPDYSDLCFIAGFKGVSYQELIGSIMKSFLKRNPGLSPQGRAAA
jgi:D-alanine-D-alanine ligase